MKKRLLSTLLCAAMLVTSVPTDIFASVYTSGQEQNVQSENVISGNEIDYALDGGSFTDGYEAPDTYPTSDLPDKDNLKKPGYEFDGWYDNEDFEGEKVVSLDSEKYSGDVVLYAKWIERYYYVDIPTETSADGSEFSIGVTAGGLYEEDFVGVTVNSENDWKLIKNDKTLAYEIRNKDNGVKLENDSMVISLESGETSSRQNYVAKVTETPQYTGKYEDKLTFNLTFNQTEFSVIYEGNGGTVYRDEKEISDERFMAGKQLDDLPVSAKNGYTFIGWCYDAECTKYVSSSDRLLDNITLYASYMENRELETVTMDTFARAIDQSTDFTIQIVDKTGKLTETQIKSALNIKNVSDSDEKIVLKISKGEGNIFTVSSTDGWKEGSAYRLELDNDALYFNSFDPTIREYDFTIFKDDVNNVSINEDIRYIHTKDLSELTVNGKSVKSVSVSAMTVGTDGSVTEEGKDTTGTFVYTKQTLKVGEQIAVYSGDVIPGMEMSASESNDVSFFEITKADGNKYSYKGSKAEDILFMPDVFPISASKDKDRSINNNSIQISISDMTFGDDELSKKLEFDEDTTIDIGDYIAVYEGNLESGRINHYGKINGVNVKDSDYIITYDVVDWNTVQESMDVYKKENVEGEELLEGADVEKLENDVEKQAIDSGFAEEVVTQIADAAMKTDSFKELQESLQADMGADVQIKSRNVFNSRSIYEKRVRASKDPRVEAELDSVKAELGTTLKHFDGDISGLRLALEVGVKVTIHINDKADIEILLTATFEQEVRVDINVDGEAVWKVWGFIPYIADYRVTASLDLYEYTGIGLNATFKTAENNEIEEGSKLRKGVNKITEELKDMMENGDEYFEDKKLVSVNFGDTDEDEQISVAKSLAERYSELLEDEADWVVLYNKNLVNYHYRVLLIIDIQVKLDFVVRANVNVSMGMTYWYKNAKRYVFCIRIKNRSATSDTIDLCEEQYEFTAYAMGTIALKAGVMLTLKVGLISTELASVGISAEVGGYAQVWGYLYYELKYAASTGRTTRAMGAIYFELGIYMDIKFRAEALAQAFTYSPTLFEKQWPLYTVGTLENVLDFVDTQDEFEDVNLKRDIKSVEIPDEYFDMQYMDMKEGLDDGEFFEKNYADNSKYFKIVMTNPAFTYDEDTNIITVNPGNEPEQDGEMIITWKCQEGAFDTTPPSRRISLHWDRLRDGYYIAFQSNGGSYVNSIDGKYNTDIVKPSNPVKQGYIFKGWYEDEKLTKPYTIPERMPDKDSLVYAKWEADDVNYTIINCIEGTNGVYEEEKPIVKKAKTDSVVSPVPEKKEGFITPTQLSKVVRADGSTVIYYYYARDSYNITFISEGEVISEGSYKYGSIMPAPSAYYPGYKFEGWFCDGSDSVTAPDTVPSKDTTYVAKWTPDTGIPYVVKYYVENNDRNGYTLSEISTLTGTTGEVVTAPEAEGDLSIYHIKGTLPKGKVAADGSLVLKVYYDLNDYELTFDTKGGKLSDANKKYVTYAGDKLVLPVPTRLGYVFNGWFLDEACTKALGNTMPAENTTVYAKWEKLKVNYTVRHYQENLADKEIEAEVKKYTLVDEEVFTAYPGDMVTPETKNYEGFTLVTVKTAVEVTGDDEQVIEYYYDRNVHNLGIAFYGTELDDGIMNQEQYGANVIDENQYMPGYEFAGWYEDSAYTIPFSGIMPDRDLTIYAKWNKLETLHKVKYYVRALEDGLYGIWKFDLYDETESMALTDTIEPTTKPIEGFVTPDTGFYGWSWNYDEECWEYEYYYDRASYNVTYIINPQSEDVDKVEEKKYGTEIDYVPVQSGKAFVGWYTDEGCTQEFTGTVPAKDITLYAKWEPGKQSYQVRHYLQSVDNEETYVLDAVENFIGIVNGEVTPDVKKDYTGFSAPTPKTVILNESEEAIVINYYYDRQKYDVKLVKNDDSVDDGEVTQMSYGTVVETPYRTGYKFAGWYTDENYDENTKHTGIISDKSVKLYAKWEAKDVTYSVKYYLQNANDDEYVLDSTKQFTAKTGSEVYPEVPLYDGFVQPESKKVTVAGDESTVVEYYYKRSTHKLTIMNKDGSEEKCIDVRYGASIPRFTKAGYTFLGWYIDINMETEYKDIMPNNAMVLYAKCEAQKVNYRIEYYLQNLENENYELKESVNKSAIADSEIFAELNNYEGFMTPTVTKSKISGDGSTVIAYYYTRNKYKIIFDGDNGEPPVIIEGLYGSVLNVPSFSKLGSAFIGWDKEVSSTIMASSETYKALWTKIPYTVKFQTGSGGTEIAVQTLTYGDKITKPANPTKNGYIFDGWDNVIPETMPAGSLTFNAKWKKVNYNISYNLNGGTISGAQTVYDVESNVITLKEPTRKGYTFTGWSGTGIDGIKKDVAIVHGSTGNRSYTANWKENTYTIYFTKKGDGASGNMSSIKVSYTQKIKLPSNEFKCEGYKFTGWTYSKLSDKAVISSKNGSMINNQAEVSQLCDTPNGSITLYPNWKAETYKITFNHGNGTTTQVNCDYNSNYNLPTPAPRYGWKFIGWKLKNSDTVTYKVGKKSAELTDAENISLTAEWVANNYYKYTNTGNKYRVTDKHELTMFTFYVDGQQKDVNTTGDTGLNPARYVKNMNNISANAVRSKYSKTKVKISFKVDKIDNGYGDFRFSYCLNGTEKENKNWKTEQVDLRDEDGQTFTYEYTIYSTDVKYIRLEFDAHGKGPDKYDMSNLKVEVTFEK